MSVARHSGRRPDELRPVSFQRGFTRHAEGAVLVCFGDTRVICTASVEAGVPPFLRGSGSGWVTAEYGMLPRSTGTRMRREAAAGKPGGRTQEIQRLVGRSLRAMVDMAVLGENTVQIDCDVIQADGGTRTAAITGGAVALADALAWMQRRGMVKANPLRQLVAAVSVGMVNGVPLLDLDYGEDSAADTDMNVVMTEGGGFIEVQGTAEKQPFSRADCDALLELARAGVTRLLALQRHALD